MKLYNLIKTTLLIFIGKIALPASPVQKASIRLSALLTGIKGSIGGTTFSGVGSGVVAKIKVVMAGKDPEPKPRKTASSQVAIWAARMASPDNPGVVNPDGSQYPSPSSRNSTNNIRTVSKAWGNLLESDRQAWQQVAANNPSKNKFGETYTASAFQTYMAVNLNRLMVGLSPVARPSCTIVKVVDDAAQEEMTCLICDGKEVWCMYSDDWSPQKDGGANERMQTTFTGNSTAYLLIYCSLPMSPGRSRSRGTKVIGILKTVEGYDNFILRPIMNAWFGKNLSGQNFQLKIVSLSPGGAATTINQFTMYLPHPAVGAKIKYTLKAQTFTWLGTDTLLDYGSSSTSDTPLTKTILIYGIDLAVKSSYTIVLTQTSGSAFSVVYGDPSEPLDLDSLLTDKYGNILPIPLKISLDRVSSGTFTGYITITQGSEILVINLIGIVT